MAVMFPVFSGCRAVLPKALSCFQNEFHLSQKEAHTQELQGEKGYQNLLYSSKDKYIFPSEPLMIPLTKEPSLWTRMTFFCQGIDI